MTTPRQHRVVALSPAGAGPLAISLNAAVLYLAVSLSSVIGAIALDAAGSAIVLPVIAAIFVLAAAVLSGLSALAERGSGRTVLADRIR